MVCYIYVLLIIIILHTGSGSGRRLSGWDYEYKVYQELIAGNSEWEHMKISYTALSTFFGLKISTI